MGAARQIREDKRGRAAPADRGDGYAQRIFRHRPAAPAPEAAGMHRFRDGAQLLFRAFCVTLSVTVSQRRAPHRMAKTEDIQMRYRPVARALAAVTLFLFLSLSALSLTACGGGAADLLSYQERPLRLVLSFETGGVTVRAELTLGERPAGGGARDATLTYLSPENLSGITYTRAGGKATVRLGEETFPVGDAPLAVTALFDIPKDARVTDIVREDSGERRATLTAGDSVYTLLFAVGEDRPRALSRRTGDTDYLAATVEAYL